MARRLVTVAEAVDLIFADSDSEGEYLPADDVWPSDVDTSDGSDNENVHGVDENNDGCDADFDPQPLRDGHDRPRRGRGVARGQNAPRRAH